MKTSEHLIQVRKELHEDLKQAKLEHDLSAIKICEKAINTATDLIAHYKKVEAL